MSDKTKAALQGRQCHNTKTQQSQDITAADQVNNYGKIPVFIGVAYSQHAPAPSGMAEGVKPPSLLAEAGIPASELSDLCLLLYMTLRESPYQYLPPYLAFGSCQGCSDVSNGQPFGLASRSKRWRQASLTHALNWPGPAASSICSKSSSSKRIFFFVLPDRSKAGLVFLSCIGTYRYCRLKINGTYQFVFVQPLNTAKPGVLPALTGPLTKPLIEVTAMADQQHTQTHPKFTWHFLALPRADVNATPCHLSISAVSEKEARRVLAPYFILSLSGRLPAQEVRHA